MTHWLAAALLLLALYAQLQFSSAQKSASFDEAGHLVAGYAYFKTGTRQFVHEVLPLGGMLTYVPLWLLGRELPLDEDVLLSGDFSASARFWEADPDPARAVELARWGVMWAALLLAAVIYRFATDVWGRRAGLLALLLAVTDPNLIANGRLATRDLLLTLFIVCAAWFLYRHVGNGTRSAFVRVQNLVGAGVCIGLAAATKYSAALLAPMLLGMAVVAPGVHNWRGYLRRAGLVAAAGVVGFFTLWAIYRFDVGPLEAIGFAVPAPSFWQGALSFSERVSRGTIAFLFGQRAEGSWWYFFPVTLLVKTPLPTLTLLLFAGVWVWQSGDVRPRRTFLALLVPAAIYLAVAASGNLAIGYRHLLPMLPFLLVLASGAAVDIQTSEVLQSHVLAKSGADERRIWYARLAQRLPKSYRSWIVLSLGVAAVASALLIFPHHQSYFNALVGGARNGYRVLVDSSLDWGQDLPALRTWMATNGADEINLSYFGTADPARYGVAYRPLPSFTSHISGAEVLAYNPYSPEPGLYAISATGLQLGLVDEQWDLYTYFRDQQPVARAGYSILIYKVDYPSDEPHQRAVVVGQRVSDIASEELGIVRGELTRVKWTGNADALILAGAGAGRYIGAQPDVLRPAWAAALQSGLTAGAGEFDARSLIEAITKSGELCTSAWTPEGDPVTLPVANAAGLVLLGYDVAEENLAAGELTVTTYWRVAGPVATPLAEFVHWWGADQSLLGQFDGWGAAARGLEAGDVIVQRARLHADSGPSGEGWSFQVGLYSPDTLARYSFNSTTGLLSDRLQVACTP